MESVFLAKLLLSFFVGGIWITGSTVLAEKFGTKIGGLITGLPSTVIVSFFFIAWTQSLETAVLGTSIMPMIQGVNYGLILVYVFLAMRYPFWIAFGGAIAFWFVSSLTFVQLQFNDFGLAIILYLTILAVSYILLEYNFKVKSSGGRKVQYRLSMLLYRGFFSGFVIAFSVIMAQIGGPLLGGAFAMFPAVFTSTIVITHYAHGSDFSAGVLKMALLGSASVVIYGACIRYFYIPHGLWLGTLYAILISFASSAAIYYLVRTRVS